jgi:DNA-binding winged helix-turn-helix (wHTH) protein
MYPRRVVIKNRFVNGLLRPVWGGHSMKSRVACIRITSPDGRHSTHELSTGRITVGRATPDGTPDVALEPDTHRLVSRVHCVVEYVDGSWTLTDNGSYNGTMLRRNGELSRVFGSVVLRHGDAVMILGDLTDDESPAYWKLKLDDPFRTEPAPGELTPVAPDAAPHLVYDWIQMKVWRVDADRQVEITGLKPQAHKLIRYMAELSRLNAGSPVACSHTDLIHMMWGTPEEWPPGRVYDETNLRNIVNAVRKRIEIDPANPRLLQTERNIGYRLMIRVSDEQASRQARWETAG